MQEFGIDLLTKALTKVETEIKARGGDMTIKMAPTAVGAEEEAALAKALEEAERANMEIEGDSEEEEDDE